MVGGETGEEPPESSAAMALGQEVVDRDSTRPVRGTAEGNEGCHVTLP